MNSKDFAKGQFQSYEDSYYRVSGRAIELEIQGKRIEAASRWWMAWSLANSAKYAAHAAKMPEMSEVWRKIAVGAETTARALG